MNNACEGDCVLRLNVITSTDIGSTRDCDFIVRPWKKLSVFAYKLYYISSPIRWLKFFRDSTAKRGNFLIRTHLCHFTLKNFCFQAVSRLSEFLMYCFYSTLFYLFNQKPVVVS